MHKNVYQRTVISISFHLNEDSVKISERFEKLTGLQHSVMSEKKSPEIKKTFSIDWLISGVLTKVGEIFDRFTGRKWQPSSSLATSELIVRLKKLLDTEVRDLEGKGRFVPHNIKLKMQWNKFSTDAEASIKKLEEELLVAAIDHINDNRYHTYKPLNIEIKPDYFTEGVKFIASFGDLDNEEAEMNVTVPQMKTNELLPEETPAELPGEIFIAEYTINNNRDSIQLKFAEGKRITVGRTKENSLSLEDQSVSKAHATLILNAENKLMVADTGSTNGTFINDQRIAYGRAFPVNDGDKLKFGTVEVFLRRQPKATDFQATGNYNAQLPPSENQINSPAPVNGYKTDKAIDEFATRREPVPNFDKTLAIDDFKQSADNGEEKTAYTQNPRKN